MIMTRAYEDLKYRTGQIVAGKESTPELNVYRVALDLYPSSYQLQQHLIQQVILLFKHDGKAASLILIEHT